MGKTAPIIGLTGPTGAGKSLVADILAGQGCEIIDCDIISREICLPGGPVLKRLAENFGDDIILRDGSLDRRLLARRAFSSPSAVARLNGITHPAITRLAFMRARAAATGGRPAVIDAAALFESGGERDCDFTVAVVAPLGIRLERILERDNIDEKSAMERINAQNEESYYCERADYIVRNYPPFELKDEMKDILERI